MKEMTIEELKKRLEQREVLLVDVREPAEHRSECIEGACLIPLGQIELSKLPTQSVPIVLHCRSGKRSQEACQKLLRENPHLEVYSLQGGITAWQEAGLKVKKSGPSTLPLDRQTQLAAGSLALVGTILGFAVSSSFFVLPGAVGLGLMMAGLTGWCGMAKLLAKMPWNR